MWRNMIWIILVSCWGLGYGKKARITLPEDRQGCDKNMLFMTGLPREIEWQRRGSKYVKCSGIYEYEGKETLHIGCHDYFFDEIFLYYGRHSTSMYQYQNKYNETGTQSLSVRFTISATEDGVFVRCVVPYTSKFSLTVKFVYKGPEIISTSTENVHPAVTTSRNTKSPVSTAPTTVSSKVEKAIDNRNNVTPPSPSSQCGPTITKVRGGSACAGQIIFEDNFDSLKEDVWQIEQFIPVNNPEFPFVSYQRLSSDPTVSVVNGNLRIIPKLQQNMPGFNNESIYSESLNLFSGCTRSSTECSAEAWGASILPPVVSGRVTSKGLAFTYGTVHVRAKLPQGDWLYPDILLEPFLQKYGSLNYASGVMRIASARGNNELNVGVTDFGNKVLYGGPIMDSECRQYLLFEKKLFNGKAWGDDFHVYSINWTPDRITLLVDSEEWARIEPATGGLLDYFPPVCANLPRDRLATGTKLAPFDDHFYLTLGLAAGGVTEFKDDLYSRGVPKPWRNPARKASLNFWQAMDSWYSTWSTAELLVDYVKVVAL